MLDELVSVYSVDTANAREIVDVFLAPHAAADVDLYHESRDENLVREFNETYGNMFTDGHLFDLEQIRSLFCRSYNLFRPWHQEWKLRIQARNSIPPWLLSAGFPLRLDLYTKYSDIRRNIRKTCQQKMIRYTLEEEQATAELRYQ